MASYPLVQVDAFSDRPFGGNPAAICLLTEPATPAWMQRVAMEMQLSETAFLVPESDGFGLRWFTPEMEVNLCGHATLASAHMLWTEGHLDLECAARFQTRSGLLTATRQGAWIEMDFPARMASECEAPMGLLVALGTTQPEVVGWDGTNYVVELGSEAEVRSLHPNFAQLRAIPALGTIVTARATTAPYDAVSRYFAPRAGIDEDPVTGSAHCTLGPYWQQRLGKSNLLAYQASTRGGVVKVRCAGDRVAIGGQAVTVLRGELLAGAASE